MADERDGADMEASVEQQVNAYGIPRIGDPAPDFEAETTFGVMSLEDFRGSWVVFFSHPADFTPVCTTEFIGFAKHYDEFEQLGVKLLGLSVDGIYSHIAWVRNIEEKFSVKIPFPVVADVDARVAYLYGMIMPGDSSMETSRCVFVIDPEGVIRALIYYPLTTGRNIQEILRLVKALQTCDQHGVGTPADWKPGDPVIEYPPRNVRDAEEVCSRETEIKDWYFRTRKL